MSTNPRDDVTERYILRTPGVCGGRPHIAGRRIAVHKVYLWHEILGMSADEIASEYDLTLAQVHAALSYCFDHLDEVNAEIERDEEVVAEARARHKSRL